MATNGALIEDLKRVLPDTQVITDDLRRLAYGTDGSFYRLIPQVIAVVENEAEVQSVLRIGHASETPVTFRAAGTSLSGQAVSDGILALIGEGFATSDIAADALSVRLGPGIVGAEANRRLAPFGRKIGPDPASINACKIGGIAANNASGMCCGTAQNSYNTMSALRVVFADGAVLDTEDAASVAAFRLSHADLLAGLAALADEVRADATLAARIRKKFKIKNTTGYSLNALVDYSDPIDILSHLMIGSEGTLGFISRITYRTVVEEKFKASALVFFQDIAEACQAVIRLKPLPVSAVELLDRASLRSVESKPGLPPVIRSLPEDASALLIEVRAGDQGGLVRQIETVTEALSDSVTIEPVAFSTDPHTCEIYWKVRKGTFPSVGAVRQTGTTVIIEDVAFPIEDLANATLDLQALLRKHGYHEGIIFGHALEGNLHFVFTQDFAIASEIERYGRFMDDVCELVAVKYEGSLKAEHGTGRNMAPFVELEWGKQATDLMRRIKTLFDPAGLLNPGVIINTDPRAHLANLKGMPAAMDIVDKCIECGFCEPMCPSHRLTLSPRQRITGWREISRLQCTGEEAETLRRDYAYFGLDTCAGCGLCATACPVGIDTGEFIRKLRGEQLGGLGKAVGGFVQTHFGTVAAVSRVGLGLGHAAASVLGDATLGKLSGGAWRSGMPRPAPRVTAPAGEGDPVVYFTTCASRIFGPSDTADAALPEVVMTLLQRAGFAPRLPQRVNDLCCGQALASKGLAGEADAMAEATYQAILAAADDGKGGLYPVILDASACSARMAAYIGARLRVYDFHQFAHDALLPRLMISKQPGPVALHVNCSLKRTGRDAKLRALARACVEQVAEAAEVTCCGFGGDRGFQVPELNHHALRTLHEAIPQGCDEGYSSNRTCEIGLTDETGIDYKSIAYLLEKVSRRPEIC